MEELDRKKTGTTNTLKFLGNESETGKAIRVLLVDGHELIRQGLRRILESEEDMEVVGDCADADKAFFKVASLHPDIVLMDPQMPGMNGIEATRGLKKSGLDYGGDVIILAESVDYQTEAMEAGAARYLLKDVTRVELARAIREVHLNRHSLGERGNLVEEVVELVILPPANAASLLRFMFQLEERLHDTHNNHTSIMRTVGSWKVGTVITILTRSTALSSLMDELGNMPEVEKVEEEPLGRGAFPSFPEKFVVLARSSINPSPSRRLRVTLKETSMFKQELSTVLN